MSLIRRKLVIVGDSGCGKTCLRTVSSGGSFPEKVTAYYEGFVVHLDCPVAVDVDGRRVELALRDTEGEEEYDRLRPVAYPDSHAVLICFAVDYPYSLENVLEKWISEVQHFCPGLPIILVGCKKDLRCEPIDERRSTSQCLVTREEAMAVSQKIGAKHYLECSAKTGEGVQKVLHYATRTTLHRRKFSKGCIVT